ncbi:hypothetical protein STHU_12240 [Allostella humosa]|uniref:hypothetical protein n=1 Tax=Stella humosa TaxID=94 RepID=UPI0011337C19|nr:hypothetical protein [Stella humosa]BBK30590.1 hypothetical protein STHU_12240 [Stella humosa]
MPAQPLWNAADKDADLTLSNANRTWQAASGLVGAVRSTIGLSAGKWHVQLSHVSSAGSAARHGFATAGHAIGTPPGDTAQSWVINGQGTIRAGGSNGADYDNFANGDAVDLFVDLDAGRIWYGRGGTVHAGNPAAGTGAMHSFTGGTTLFLAGGMDGGGTTRGGTLRLLADYVGTTPAGFSRGWGSAGDGVELTIGAAALAVQGRGATLVSGTGQGLAVATSGLAAGGAAVGLSVGMLGQAAAGAAAATGALASVQAGVGAFATAIGGEVVLAGGSAEAAISGGIALAAAAGRCITTGAAGALVAGQMLMAAAAVPMATGHPGLLQAGTGQLCEAGAATIEATGSPVVIGAGAGVDCISVPGAVAWAGSPIALSAGQLLHGGPGGVQASPGAADLLAGAGQSLASATASVVLSGAVPSVIGGAGVALDAMAGEWFANGHSVGLAVGTGAVLAVARGEVVLAEGLASVSIAWDFAGTVAAGGATIVGGACVVAAGTPVLNPVPMPGDLAALLAPAAGTLEWVVTIDAWDAETATLVPLRWSAGDYITRAADDPASTRFPGRLADFQLRRQLWSGMAVFGRSEPARGVVVLENADGALDHLATAVTTTGGRRWHFRWRRVQVMVGHPAWPWAAFRPVFTGLVEEPAFDDGRATFLVRDRLRRLDRPLQDATFRGDRVLLASASSVAVGFGARTFVLPDLVANGGFATSLAGWDAGADWIGGSARATKSPGVSAALEQNLATAADNLYRVRLDVVRTAGSLQPMAGGEPVGDPIAATGTYRPTFLAVGSTTRLSFRADADFAGTVDAVSVRQEPLAVAGDGVRIARTGDLTGTWMAGTVAGWTEATGELAVEATDCAGTGTHADWSIWLRPHAGTAELAGKNLPAVLGTVRHAQPPELGSVQGLWLYRLADGPVRVEPALGHGIHDGGVLLDPAESFPPAPGQAFVDAAEGALWVASRPQYPLTATLDGGLGATAGRRVFAVPGGYSFRVPAGVTALRAKLWGSRGGHGGVGTTGFPGGGGGFVDGVLAVAPGDLLTVVVPGGGGAGNGGVTAGAGGMSPGSPKAAVAAWARLARAAVAAVRRGSSRG